MSTSVPIRRLQQHASDLIERVRAGERIEITRNGRLVAVLVPPDSERRVYDDLVEAGLVDPEESEEAGSLAGWEPLPPQPGVRSLSASLAELREEESR